MILASAVFIWLTLATMHTLGACWAVVVRHKAKVVRWRESLIIIRA